MLDETSLPQRLTAEFLGTAFLVFIGVGSVPARHLVNGNAPFTMADLGMISLAFATIVVATVYALGHIGGNHINPAVTLGLAVTGKFPWRRGARRTSPRRSRAPCSGPSRSSACWAQKASDIGLGVASYGDRSPLVPGVLRRVHRHVPPGVRGLRRHLPQGGARLGRPGHRHGRVRRDHPGRPDHRRLDQPGAHHRPDARPADHRRRRCSGSSGRCTSIAELLAGVAAASCSTRVRRRHAAGPAPTSR